MLSSSMYMDDNYTRTNQTPQEEIPQSDTAKDKKKSRYNDLISTVVIIILAPLVALFLTQFVFQSYQVDGPSMEQTLHHGDRLIVTKVGKTWARATGGDYKPDRYDVIIFNHSADYGNGRFEEKQLVKRVIGVPGDRIHIEGGVATIYNKEHPDGFLVDKEGPEANTITVTYAPDREGVIDEEIKEGQVYVMGDNRENSLDSRSFGTVSDDNVVGHLALRIYPFSDFQKF